MAGTIVRLALSSVLLAALPVGAETPRSGPAPEPESFARAWLEAWDAHDVDRIVSFYTEDAFYEDVPTVDNGWAVPSRDHRTLRESLVSTFEEMPDLSFELVSASGAGDRLVVEWIMTGTRYRDYSGEFSIRAVSVVRLEGNRIASVSDYYDAYRLLLQLGIVPPLGGEPDAALRARIDAFVDEWHEDAAHARLAYFEKIASDGVYIGTDRTERWTRDEFREWARPYFERPSAWTFKSLHRNVDFSPDRTIAWFDEQLESRMGTLQASGVIRRRGDGFEIVHYQLSIAVPNEVQPAVSETIRELESAGSRD